MGFLDRFRSGPGAEPESLTGAFVPLREAALEGVDLGRQRELLVEGLEAHGLSHETVAAVLGQARDGILLLELGDAGRASRVGGAPLLPPGEPWPLDPDGEPFTFVAALDLGELPALAPLPAAGTLLVYWSERFAEWEHMDFRAATRVFLTEEPVPAMAPKGATASPAIPLTGVLTPIVGEQDRIEPVPDDVDPLYDALDDLNVATHGHQLLGASRDVQGPVLEEVGYWFEQGFPATRADYGEAEIEGEGWTLLGQIESTGDLMFGDAGSLYLVLPEADLEARRFDRVLGIMQCT